MKKKKFKSDFLNFANSYLMKILLFWLPFITLFIGNFIILLVFSNFFDMNNKAYFISYFWIIFLISTFFSSVILKTNLILDLISHKKKKENKENGREKDFSEFKIGKMTSGILSIKAFFFNILNDLFILLIVNFLLVGIFWYSHAIPFVSKFDSFVGLISLIGIVSGLYHFYIKNYKENISDKVGNALNNYIISHIKKISFGDFLKTLEQKKEGVSEIRKKLYTEKNVDRIPSGSYRHKVYLVEIPSYFDISGFLHLEDFIRFKKDKGSSLTQEYLNKKYEEYFKIKFDEFKKDLDSEDLNGTRSIILSGILFFDEVIANLNKLNLQDPKQEKEKENPRSFVDYYENFQQDCLNYMLEILLNQKEGSKNEK